MRPAIAFAPVLTLTALAGWGTPAAAQVASHTHVVTAANQDCTGNRCTRLIGSSWYPNHGEVRLLATSNWNPPGSAGVYYAASIEVGTLSDGVNGYRVLVGPPGEMPVGAAFNVLTVRQASCAYGHFASASNVSGNVTFLDRPGLNGNPFAAMHVLQVGSSAPDPLPVGVYYDSDVGRWGIFNEDLSAMSTAAVFTVLDTNCTAAVSGLSQGFVITCLGPSGNHCSLAGVGGADPRAKLLVTQLWSEDAPVYNPHPIGVYFNGSEWRVFNEDLAAMPSGARFFVSVINVVLRDDFETGDLAAWAGGSLP